MPLWLDLLRTPMAAPETVPLRAKRRTWQLLCLSTALAVGLITPLRGLIGSAAPRIAALLIVATLLQSRLYWGAKRRADDKGHPGNGEEME
ncbi:MULTISPECIES: hypothetical protein [Sphingobium]|uniref:Uncharacterized protein n=1 Tax=Sphingobium chungbukense TaxID=56193 RepID=A0A0M3ANQ5_9SPHN|nr:MULTISPECIES: hypothetical protein [Sphingobium]AMK26065.1 hypothetical protein K426_25825 [Sphingobium sp. TKS]KKW90566.1 hypothetical protein YP76_18410 [Sphingobium chungbukense]